MASNEVVRFLVNDGRSILSFGLASIQPEGSLSVGLADRLFKLTHMTESVAVGGEPIKRTVDLVSLYGLEPSRISISRTIHRSITIYGEMTGGNCGPASWTFR